MLIHSGTGKANEASNLSAIGDVRKAGVWKMCQNPCSPGGEWWTYLAQRPASRRCWPLPM